MLRAWLAHLVEFDLTDQATLTVVGLARQETLVTPNQNTVVAHAAPPEPGEFSPPSAFALARSFVMESIADGRLGPSLKLIRVDSQGDHDEIIDRIFMETAIGQRMLVRGTATEMLERFAEAEVDSLDGEANGHPVGGLLGTDRRENHPAPCGPCPAVGWRSIRRNGIRPWIVTGGARGITALCAARLTEKFGVRLHLVGRTTPIVTLADLRDRVPNIWHGYGPGDLTTRGPRPSADGRHACRGRAW